ncbi:MAG: 50S ribosomal protein L31 [Bdellovibrionaceae bacterium]|nr:50S ribosomal protein L31 [Pseudobdellovibrionaceae bacterium]|tara:strand:- start:89 stop:346 length:258 start_codon:yes stop_codon:yes gene_type:complete
MKKEIHPEFREVVFQDVSCDFKYKTLSTAASKETVEYEGATYPLIKVDISSASHPFYTGKQRIMDTEGRAERFKKKFGTRHAKKN